MDTRDHIRALRREGHLLLDAAASSGLSAAVPSCPGWRVRDLLAHIHYVHRWAAAYVTYGLAEMASEPPEDELLAGAPPDDSLLARVEEGHAALVRALSDAPTDLACWTFLPAPSPLAMWARRQAHETAIHRVDAELAAGRSPAAFDPQFAVDGIDELLLGFLSRKGRPEPNGTVLGTIGFEAHDVSQWWSVRLASGRVETTHAGRSCDLLVRTTASDLYLLLWNRPPAVDPDATGAVELLEAWHEQVRVNWS